MIKTLSQLLLTPTEIYATIYDREVDEGSYDSSHPKTNQQEHSQSQY